MTKSMCRRAGVVDDDADVAADHYRGVDAAAAAAAAAVVVLVCLFETK